MAQLCKRVDGLDKFLSPVSRDIVEEGCLPEYLKDKLDADHFGFYFRKKVSIIMC